MKRRHCVGLAGASAASIVACVALFSVPAVRVAAAPGEPPEEAAGGTGTLLARGAGYGLPKGDPRVRALQRRLQALGQRPGPVDGHFGRLTEAAVEQLQRDMGLSVDGIVGPQTRRVLRAEPRDQPAPRANGSRPAGRSDQSRTLIPAAVRDPTAGADAAEVSPMLLVALALALALGMATSGGLLGVWLKGRRPGPEAGGVDGQVMHDPMPNGGQKAAKPSAGSSAASAEPGPRRNGTAALGYASVRDTACAERLVKEVIRDLEHVNHREPAVQSALQANGSSRSSRHDVPALKERIRQMRASGMTLQAIADRLNAEKVPTLRGGVKWRPSGVQAATGYRRPGLDASKSNDRGARNGNGSSGRRRARPRRPASRRTGGGIR
jgi:Putative peptidoglycan binding domain